MIYSLENSVCRGKFLIFKFFFDLLYISDLPGLPRKTEDIFRFRGFVNLSLMMIGLPSARDWFIIFATWPKYTVITWFAYQTTWLLQFGHLIHALLSRDQCVSITWLLHIITWSVHFYHVIVGLHHVMCALLSRDLCTFITTTSQHKMIFHVSILLSLHTSPQHFSSQSVCIYENHCHLCRQFFFSPFRNNVFPGTILWLKL